MKCMTVYSSKTGNTQKIAEAVHETLPPGSDIFPVQQAPVPDDYDFIAIGSWVDKGMPDPQGAAYMRKIHGKNIGVFMTLGAYPDSDHAGESMQKARELLKDNTICGTFICQGRVDPHLIRRMQKMTIADPNHPHAMDEKRKARLEEAAKHPNEQDCQNAANTFREIVQRLQGKTHA